MFVKEIETKIEQINNKQTKKKYTTKLRTKQTNSAPYIGPKVCDRNIDTILRNKQNIKQQQMITNKQRLCPALVPSSISLPPICLFNQKMTGPTPLLLFASLQIKTLTSCPWTCCLEYNKKNCIYVCRWIEDVGCRLYFYLYVLASWIRETSPETHLNLWNTRDQCAIT